MSLSHFEFSVGRGVDCGYHVLVGEKVKRTEKTFSFFDMVEQINNILAKFETAVYSELGVLVSRLTQLEESVADLEFKLSNYNQLRSQVFENARSILRKNPSNVSVPTNGKEDTCQGEGTRTETSDGKETKEEKEEQQENLNV